MPKFTLIGKIFYYTYASKSVGDYDFRIRILHPFGFIFFVGTVLIAIPLFGIFEFIDFWKNKDQIFCLW